MIAYHVYVVGTLRHHKIVNLEATVLRDRRWEPQFYGSYCALPIDTQRSGVPDWKTILRKHYDHRTGKALPAIIFQ
jgi:hypothetical protein